MAWYEISYTCGHSEREQLYGPEKDRQRKIEWKERGMCPACYRAAQSQKAEQAANAAGLPALTGSDKQIAWAQTIRAGHVALMDKWLAQVAAAKLWGGQALTPETEALRDLGIAIANQLRAELLAETESRFWIDNRDYSGLASRRFTPEFRARLEASPLYRQSQIAKLETAVGADLVGGA